MKSKTEKILIFGIDSFTGRYLCDLCADSGYDVHGTVLGPESDKNYYCDIRDSENIQKVLSEVTPHYIIHLSAKSFVADKDIESFYNVNLFGTRNVLEAVSQSGIPIKKLIIASSANVYGNANMIPIPESLRPMPNNQYAISKYAMEQMVETYFDKIPIIITRPFNYTGIGQSQSFIIPKIVYHFKMRKEEIRLGNTDISRDFSDVRDVAHAYLILLQSHLLSDIVNICSSQSTAITSIIDTMKKISGHDITIITDEKLIRSSDITILTGDNTKLRNLGYKRRYSIIDTS